MIQSIVIVTKTGKVILSRQNVPISRIKIEGLHATFTRMVNTTQNSSFEAEGVRFVYRSYDDVYIVLITTLSSNIIEDTEILNSIIVCLQSKFQINSKSLTHGMFEALFIIDEFLQWGFEEKLQANVVKTNLLMRSKDEEIYLRQLEMKKEEAKRLAKEKAIQLKEEKQLKEKIKMMEEMQNRLNFDSNDYSRQTKTNDYVPIKQEIKEEKKPVKKPSAKKPNTSVQPKGLQLGKKKQSEQILETIKKEENLETEDEIMSQQQENQQQENVNQKPIQPKKKEEKKLMLSNVIVKELEVSTITVSVETNQIECSINGNISIAVAEGVEPILKLSPVEIPTKCQLHPTVDPKSFNEERIIKMKPGKKFSINTPAVYCKWNYKSNEFKLPIVFSCWPSENENGLALSLSYEVISDINNVIVEIPKLGNIQVNSIENGNLEEDETIQWIIGNVKEGDSASLEIDIIGSELDQSLLYPMNVIYEINTPLTGNDINEVTVNDNSIEFEKEISIKSTYQIIP